MRKICSKLEATEEQRRDRGRSVWGAEAVPLNRVSGEDLDEKVTTKSGPEVGSHEGGGCGGVGVAEQRRAEREGELGPAGLEEEEAKVEVGGGWRRKGPEGEDCLF